MLDTVVGAGQECLGRTVSCLDLDHRHKPSLAAVRLPGATESATALGYRGTMTTPTSPASDLDEVDRFHLRRCVDLAERALTAGDEPFGSLLVDATGTVRFEDCNRVKDGDPTQHPEFAIARWAAQNLTPAERAASIVYTSGEHCAMCSAAHAWVGLGRIVYASSTEQLVGWLAEWGLTPGPVRPLPIRSVAPGVEVCGPDPELTDRVRSLHARLHRVEGSSDRGDA